MLSCGGGLGMGGALRAFPSHCGLCASALALEVVVVSSCGRLAHWCLLGSTHVEQYQLGQCSQVYLKSGLALQFLHRERCRFSADLFTAALNPMLELDL